MNCTVIIPSLDALRRRQADSHPFRTRIVGINFQASFFWREPRRSEDLTTMLQRHIEST